LLQFVNLAVSPGEEIASGRGVLAVSFWVFVVNKAFEVIVGQIEFNYLVFGRGLNLFLLLGQLPWPLGLVPFHYLSI
jgi:hypothetical protein